MTRANAPALRRPLPGRRLLIALLVILVAAVVPAIVVPTLMCRPADPTLDDLGAVGSFALIDERNQPFTDAALRGHVTLVSFLFTRCDTICPVTTMKMERLQEKTFDAGAAIKLASFSVDPAYDTPAVLQAFGESRLKGERRFDQWTLATGTLAQVESVASLFGVRHQNVNGTVTHTLSTAVVGHDGRIIRVFDSNSWRPDELFDVVSRGVERASAE